MAATLLPEKGFRSRGPPGVEVRVAPLNPPPWDYETEAAPPELDGLFHLLPGLGSAELVLPVCVPYYSEPGSSFRRSVEALALQQRDLSRMVDGRVVFHIFAVADGWRGASGAKIISDSMLAEMRALFGPGFDAARIGAALGDAAAVGAFEAAGVPDAPADSVVVQLCQTGEDGQLELAPVSVDCSHGAAMRARMASGDSRLDEDHDAVADDDAGGDLGASGAEGDVEAAVDDDVAHVKMRRGFAGSRAAVSSSSSSSKSSTSCVVQIYLTFLIKRRNAKKHHSHRWFLDAFAPLTRLRAFAAAAAAAQAGSDPAAAPSAVPDGGIAMGVIANAAVAASAATMAGVGAAAVDASSRQLHSCRYYFATDCGTLFAPGALSRLIEHLDEHPAAGAATGHQRIMAAEDQLAETGTGVRAAAIARRGAIGAAAAGAAGAVAAPQEGLFESHLRAVQGFDFESQLVLFNGAHALASFLPVVPGPCGLFRAASLTVAMMAELRGIFASSAEEDGIVVANLKIAEDRVLSYLMLLHRPPAGSSRDALRLALLRAGTPLDEVTQALNASTWGWETDWVPSALFFFEAETTLSEFVLQRRRWINGTNAGLMWILSHPELRRRVVCCNCLAWRVAALSLLEVGVAATVFFLPAVFAFTGFVAIGHGAIVLQATGVLATAERLFGVGSAHNAFVVPLQTMYLAFAAVTLVLHAFHSRTAGGARRTASGGFVSGVWSARLHLAAFTMLASTAATVGLLVLSMTSPAVLREQQGNWDFNDIRLSSVFSLWFTATPFYLAALHSLPTLRAMLRALPSFILFFPVISADFCTYSTARLDDLSWGTKAGWSEGDAAAAAAVTVEVAQPVENAAADADADGSKQPVVAVDAPAIRSGSGSSAVGGAWSVRDRTVLLTHAATFMHVVLNLVLLAWTVVHSVELEHLFLYTAAVLASGPLLFAALSVLYFGAHTLCSSRGAAGSPNGSSCCDRLSALLTLATWATGCACVGVLIALDTDENHGDDGARDYHVMWVFLGVHALAVGGYLLRELVSGGDDGGGRFCCRQSRPRRSANQEVAGGSLAGTPQLRRSARRMHTACCLAKLVPTTPRSTLVAFGLLAVITYIAADLHMLPLSLSLLAVFKPTPPSPIMAGGARLVQYLHSLGAAPHLDLLNPPPIRAVYVDDAVRGVDAPSMAHPSRTVSAAVNASYNVINLAFYVQGGPADSLRAWAAESADSRAAVLSYAHSQGAVVMLSAGGETDLPYDRPPEAYGREVANFAVAHGLDGVDFDLEGLDRGCGFRGMSPEQTIQWLVAATLAARDVLGPLRLLTHAPLAPYFGSPDPPKPGEQRDATSYAGRMGCYTAVYKQARYAPQPPAPPQQLPGGHVVMTGASPSPSPSPSALPLPSPSPGASLVSAIDWLNVQYYNQETGCYGDYDSVFVASYRGRDVCSFAGTAVAEIASYGIPLRAIVVGKLLLRGDGGSNWAPADAMHAWVERAQTNLSWSGGVMVWAWERHASQQWLHTIYPQLAAPAPPTLHPHI